MSSLFGLNELIFALHLVLIAVGALVAAKMGRQALCALVCLLSVMSNLLISKQITLFSLQVTATDALAVGALFCLNLTQELFGQKVARQSIFISFAMMLFYLGATQLHLWYQPGPVDLMHRHFTAVLEIMPRLVIASLLTYLLVSLLDSTLYAFFKRLLHNRFLLARNFLSLCISQLLDTTLFSVLGLYGIVHSIANIIAISFIIKLVAIVILVPFTRGIKRLLQNT